MSSEESRITRGGITYVVPEPTLHADEVIHSLRVGRSRYFFAERVAAANTAKEGRPRATRASSVLGVPTADDESRRPLPRPNLISANELAKMWGTLNLEVRDDLRVAALFTLLCAGLRKSEIVALNFGDLREASGGLGLHVRGSRANGQQAREVSFVDEPKRDALIRYLALEHRDTQYPDAPLLWTLGRHGMCQRVRITTHALSYWVSQLQRRAGIERRLSPHSFRRAWLAAGIERG